MVTPSGVTLEKSHLEILTKNLILRCCGFVVFFLAVFPD